MTTRQEVICAARSWIGTPWRHQGRGKAGIDCGGLLIEVARELGIADVRTAAYPMQADGRSLRALCDEHMTRIPISDIAPGDAVLVKFKGNEESHVALVTDYRHGGLAMLHSLNRAGDGRVIEHRLDGHWRSMIVAAYRLRGVD